jgi:hypothetical protein
MQMPRLCVGGYPQEWQKCHRKSRRGSFQEWIVTPIAKEVIERHRAAVARKHQRIEMYHAILDSWDGRDDCDYDYLRDVRRRLHMAESQLKAMKP